MVFHRYATRYVTALSLVCIFFFMPTTATCQDNVAPAVVIPEIKDEPKSIDPSNLVAKQLAERVTVEFSESSLTEVAEWVQKNTQIPVLFDKSAMDATGTSLSEILSDRLNDEPLYLLLNRLNALGLSWYVKNDVVRITTVDAAAERGVTVPYTVGDLFDAGFESDNLSDVIMTTIGGEWMDIDGVGGSVEFLGDVLFVRQTDNLHLHLQGLLAALRNPARRTFTFDPPQHELLRQGLVKNVTVDFDDVPLIEAVRSLSQQQGIDIRLEERGLRDVRIREREPVSLALAERPLETVLDVLLADLKLTTAMRDGVLWVTSPERAAAELRTAVYDVRDLCRDSDESNALSDAILSQTGDQWMDISGDGGSLVFARPGIMVVQQTERMHSDVLRLLEAYRTALKASKPREQMNNPEKEILTRYYRTQEAISAGIVSFLKESVSPDSWRTDGEQERPGEIVNVLPAGKSVLAGGAPGKDGGTVSPAVAVDWAVIVIRQTRENHRRIADIIRRVESGDERSVDGGQMGGGFGGGYFAIPSFRRQDVKLNP